jgi:hypothetical protein
LRWLSWSVQWKISPTVPQGAFRLLSLDSRTGQVVQRLSFQPVDRRPRLTVAGHAGLPWVTGGGEAIAFLPTGVTLRGNAGALCGVKALTFWGYYFSDVAASLERVPNRSGPSLRMGADGMIIVVGGEAWGLESVLKQE